MWCKFLHLVPSLSLIPLFILLITGTIDRYSAAIIIFGIILCLAIPKFLFMIFSIAGRLIGFGSAGNIIGYCIGGAFTFAALFGLSFGWKLVTVREVALSFEDLPEAFEGYKIVQISDWHLGTYDRSKETIEKEVQKANALNPDAIVFTGDIVNGDPEELEAFIPILSKLSAKDGVFSVMGNHDYCMYGSARGEAAIKASIGKIQDMERSMGWRLLLNENEVITRGNDSLAIVGVENDGTPPFPQNGDLVKAQEDLEEGTFKVLLSHDPTHWKRKVLPETDIQLTLSGHTHAMQFRLWGISPSRIGYNEWAGLYRSGERKLFVCTGSGGNVPFRFGAWPEIVCITLHRK
ncbi:MAG: metallophosphoesterase [Bacteroidales bacterium]|nr:metallophosphoesterase [Bacteroidales bacterium]